jgi:hypothetical protein
MENHAISKFRIGIWLIFTSGGVLFVSGFGE